VSIKRRALGSRVGRGSPRPASPLTSSRRWRLHEIDWILIFVAAGVTFYLGYRGLHEAGGNPDGKKFGLNEPANQVYGALQLFFLDSPTVEDPTVELTVARFVAPVVAGVATVRAVAALFWGRAQLLYARYFVRNHSVVAGLGNIGSHLVGALEREGRSVVVVERDVATPEISGLRARGIPVVVGDATDYMMLERAGLPRATHLVAACGDDGTNVNVVFAAQTSAVPRRSKLLETLAHIVRAPRRSKPLEALAHIDDPELRGLLQARAIELWSRSTVLLECFNVFDDAAARMLEEHPFEARVGDVRPELLVVGVSRLGQALAALAADRWHADRPAGGDRLGITLMGPDACEVCMALRSRAPGLSEAIELRAEAIEVPAPNLQNRVLAAGPSQPTIVYVTGAGEGAELATAFALRRAYEESDVPIVVAVRDDRSGVATTLDKAEMTGIRDIRPFAVFSDTLKPDLLRRRTREIIARIRHEQYLRAALANKAGSAGERAALVPWNELPPWLQDSNRKFADGVGAAIEAAGCTLLPQPLMARAGSFSFSPEKLEELAEKEHERWCLAERSRNPDHPSLVPWDQLSESERMKDRDAIRGVPELLARAGFEMRPVRRLRVGDTPQQPPPSSTPNPHPSTLTEEGSRSLDLQDR
jgi:voltage-gated potassium channel Kch